MTFNPAIDYVVRMDRFNKGEVNRTQSEEIQFGGKGINVSTVLTNLGVKSCALGFLAGFTGKAIEDGMKKIGVETDFIHLGNGMTRINVKLKADCESEINGQGPEISQQALDRLFEKLDCLKPGDILVLAGSIPKSLPSDIYEKIMQRMEGREIMVVVDATKDLLCNVLKYKPFLIKPNHIELGEIFGRTLANDDEIRECAQQLQQKTEHTGTDVADIGCTLSHQFIIDIGKHLDIHLAHRVQSSFCTASRSDHFFHLTGHKRVTEHHDLTAEDFRFFFADSLANILCHLLCHFAKSIYRFF